MFWPVLRTESPILMKEASVTNRKEEEYPAAKPQWLLSHAASWYMKFYIVVSTFQTAVWTADDTGFLEQYEWDM